MKLQLRVKGQVNRIRNIDGDENQLGTDNPTAISKKGGKNNKKANSSNKSFMSTALMETDSNENTICDMETDEDNMQYGNG